MDHLSLEVREPDVVVVGQTDGAHAGGSNITADPTYQAASSASLAHPAGIMYVNMARLVSVLEKLPSSSGMQTTATGYLAPLRAFMFTATSQTGAAVERFFVAIK